MLLNISFLGFFLELGLGLGLVRCPWFTQFDISRQHPEDGATRSQMKIIKFFSVYTGGHKKRLRCLLSWDPHPIKWNICLPHLDLMKESRKRFHLWSTLLLLLLSLWLIMESWVTGHGQVLVERQFRESNDCLSVGQWGERGDRGGWDRLNAPCNAC